MSKSCNVSIYVYISILLVLVICMFLCHDIITVCDNQWLKKKWKYEKK